MSSRGRKSWRSWIGVMLLAILAATGATAFFRLRKVQATANLPVATARQGEFLVVVRCRGELRARRSAPVYAPLNVPDMRIIWQAPPGGQVKEGEPVLRLDPSSSRQQLAEKEAALKQANASLEQAIAQARLTAEQDKRDLANARYQVERAKLEVSKQEVVSKLDGEISRIDLELAEKKLRVQEATVALHEVSDKSKIASLTRVRDQAQAEVDLFRERLERMEIKAPISGVIVYQPNYSQGWMNAKPFRVGDQVWPGANLAELPDLDTLEMEGKIEEVDRGRIAAGADARIRIDSLPELSLPAKVSQISPLTQMSFEFPPTSTFRAIAQLVKRDDRLRPAMNGAMDIVARRIPNAISIPSKALFTRHGRPVVYVAAGGRYTLREVKVIARNPDEVAIEGIGANTQVTLVEPGAQPPEGASEAANGGGS
jgi:HlyD family secretion protein